MFVKSIQTQPYDVVLKSQESTILRASQDWHEAQMQSNAEGIRETTQSKARMAEVEYQVKMAQL